MIPFHNRPDRLDAVFAEGKSPDDLRNLLQMANSKMSGPVLFTRLKEHVFGYVPIGEKANITYDAESRTAWNKRWPARDPGLNVGIVSAGLNDGIVVHEARRTLEFLGFHCTEYEDFGADDFNTSSMTTKLLGTLFKVVIVVAGLDAALATVVGSIVDRPVIAVPTSAGYGVSRNGEAALASMLLSCAPGVSVMNIDNGYGAACAAARILNLLDGKKKS
jgi:NCAIR mutase (PurE)-related protein